MNLDYHGLFSHHIQSPKRGLDQNQFTGFCCFHNDKKTRSFSFNLETGLWHCFAGCGNGNAYQFAEKVNHPNPKEYISMNNAHIPHNSKKTSTRLKPNKNNDIRQNNPIKQAHTILTGDVKKLEANYLLNQEWFPGVWNLDIMLQLNVFVENKSVHFPHHNLSGNIIAIQKHKGISYGEGGKKWYAQHLLEKYDRDEPLFIVEGLQDCVTALSQGLQATSSTGGASSVPNELDLLKGLNEIVIAYDNDEAGNKGADKLSTAIKKKFIRTKIKVIQWDSSLPNKWDITDSFEQDDGRSFKEAVINAKTDRLGFNVLKMNDFIGNGWVKPQPIIENLLYEKGISVIAGSDGVGKSWIGLQIALSVSNGQELFKAFKVSRRPVLLVQFEMNNGGISSRLKK
ncbi:MAG: AAA family ATPase [Candidatus Marinimicrobia bacterium]|nr:AAA family ATPase [Candidatus Neomarinimicrobiota bacterium]